MLSNTARSVRIKQEDDLLDTSQAPASSKETKSSKHPLLTSFYKEHLHIDPDAVVTNNKGTCAHSDISPCETSLAPSSISYHSFSSPVVIYDEIGPKPKWQLCICQRNLCTNKSMASQTHHIHSLKKHVVKLYYILFSNRVISPKRRRTWYIHVIRWCLTWTS